MLDRLLKLERPHKRYLSLLVDIVCLTLSLIIALSLSANQGILWPGWRVTAGFSIALVITVSIFVKLGLYRAVIRYMSGQVFTAIISGVAASAILLYIGFVLFDVPFPKAVILNYALVALLSCGGTRLTIRTLVFQRAGKLKQKVLIYGAGASGCQLAMALRNGCEYHPVAFVDDNAVLQGTVMKGINVYSSDQIRRLIEQKGIQRILLALPSASRSKRNKIVQSLESLPIPVQSIPGTADLIDGKMSIDELQDVQIEDLLGRDQVSPNPQLMSADISGKVVMVTGSGGSIGSELCRQIILNKPQKLVLFESSEYALYSIERELNALCRRRLIECTIAPLLGSVQNLHRVESAMSAFNVQTVYHAAAYKHVPLVEYNVVEGVRNNIFGTWHSAEAAINAGVETFVLISTDKAVRPTNVMGATKRFAELVLQGLACRQDKTRFCMVRFGNVLGSSGSVVPLFRSQIQNGGPVTLTHKDITRYFMTIPEAAQLVIQAGAMGRGGDVFVLDMGEPVKIYDLAERMIHLMGLEIKDEQNPEGDIEIKTTGLRPGEKLFEELLIGENELPTSHTRIKTANEAFMEWDAIQTYLNALDIACHKYDQECIRSILLEVPTGFNPTSEICDLVWSNTNSTQSKEIA